MKLSQYVRLLPVILAAGMALPPANAATVRMAADTITIRADQTPLSEILAQLQEAGIRVAMDERINPLITASFENREIITGIKQLLTDCDYALVYDTIDGPVGKMNRLAEVLVYKTGDRRALKPRPAPPADIAKTRTATNTVTCIKNEILLRLRPGVTHDQFRALLLRSGAMVLDGIPALGIYRLRLPPGGNLAETLNAFARDSLVANAEPNLIYRPITTIRDGDLGAAPPLRTATAAAGPAVAILDSGFTPGPALAQAVVASLDATSPGQAITDPLGHGTQMAFLASGVVNPAGTDAAGSVSIIPVRTLDSNGITSGFSIMQGMVFALENGARVISMSWGSPDNSALFTDAIAYARQRGAVLVAAAGNEPTGQSIYPAALPGVIAVAAMTDDGNVWDRSNYGPFVKLAAPGFANLPVGYNGPPGRYGGTSISAAYTANIIARYLATHPNADAEQAVAALTAALTSASAGAGALHPEIPRLNNSVTAAYLK